MAIENTDLLVAYRPGESQHYKLSIANLPQSGANLPAGTTAGEVLQWDGADWVASLTIDCGTKDLGSGQFDYPD